MAGFTLIEMIVAVGVFTVMMSVIVGAFSSGALAYRGARELQKNVESAQYAMNTMAKHLRTSTIFSPATPSSVSSIRFYEYSSDRCFRYDISGGVLSARWHGIDGGTYADSDELFQACENGTVSFPASQPMTSGDVEGIFRVVPSDDGSGGTDKRIGRVTIQLTVKNAPGENEHLKSSIQTSVSLRDYGYIGI